MTHKYSYVVSVSQKWDDDDVMFISKIEHFTLHFGYAKDFAVSFFYHFRVEHVKKTIYSSSFSGISKSITCRNANL